MYKWILLGHAIGGATLFGASIYMESLMAGASRTTDPSSYMLVMLRLSKAANRLMGPASIITFIFGIWVVVETAYEFSDLFVTIGMSVIILAFAISMFLMSPREKEINALIIENGMDDESAVAEDAIARESRPRPDLARDDRVRGDDPETRSLIGSPYQRSTLQSLLGT